MGHVGGPWVLYVDHLVCRWSMGYVDCMWTMGMYMDPGVWTIMGEFGLLGWVLLFTNCVPQSMSHVQTSLSTLMLDAL